MKINIAKQLLKIFKSYEKRIAALEENRNEKGISGNEIPYLLSRKRGHTNE